MKLLNPTKLRKAAPLALMSVLGALLSPLADAATVTAAAQGDLILAFRRPQNQSGTYLVDVGPVSQLIASTPGAATPIPGVASLGADLATFGVTEDDITTSWNAVGSKVLWGGISRNINDQNVVYVTKKRTSLATQSAPWLPVNLTKHNAAYTKIGSVIQQGYSTLPATTNNPKGGFQDTPTEGISYYLQVNKAGTIDFATWSSIEGDFSAGAAASALDLYEQRPGADTGAGTITYIGYFTISNAGVVSFTRVTVDPFTVDTDHDGFSDGDEGLAGTNPNNAASRFTIPQPVKVAGGAATIQFNTIANRRYRIEYSANLQPPWVEVHVHLSGAGAAPVNFVDNDPVRKATPVGFYRASVELATP